MVSFTSLKKGELMATQVYRYLGKASWKGSC